MKICYFLQHRWTNEKKNTSAGFIETGKGLAVTMG